MKPELNMINLILIQNGRDVVNGLKFWNYKSKNNSKELKNLKAVFKKHNVILMKLKEQIFNKLKHDVVNSSK